MQTLDACHRTKTSLGPIQYAPCAQVLAVPQEQCSLQHSNYLQGMLDLIWMSLVRVGST